MFGKLFGRKKPPASAADAATGSAPGIGSGSSPSNPAAPHVDLVGESMFRAIEEQRASDPLVGARIGAREILQRLIDALKTTRGVRAEDLLATLASLAGYACQMSVRARLAQLTPEQLVAAALRGETLNTIGTHDGRKFFFGDALNTPLAESPQSVWALAAGMAAHLGLAEADFPDIHAIFKHVSGSVGGAEFGVPRLPEAHVPGEPLRNYLKIWVAFEPQLRRFCPDPAHWPVLYAMAVQSAMEMVKEVLPPQLALTLVMECAIPMSKVDPAGIG